MKKEVVLILLILLMAGCQNLGTQQTQDKPEPQEYRSGTQAIQMEFLPNMPPPQIIADAARKDEFQAMIRVENVGSEPLGEATSFLYLSGFDEGIIKLDRDKSRQKIGGIAGRGPFTPRGEFAITSYSADILLQEGIDKYIPTILAIACYKYETKASAQVCIDPDPYSPFSKEKSCTPQTVSLGSQGAPIAVTQVEVIPAPTKTRFVIHIQNAGGGHVFKGDTNSLNHCNPYEQGLNYEELNKVKVESVKLSGQDVQASCKPTLTDGYLTLINGQATLHCEADVVNVDNAYLTPLTIDLSYGYRQSISRQVQIRSAGP